jgi:hypothetical protein
MNLDNLAEGSRDQDSRDEGSLVEDTRDAENLAEGNLDLDLVLGAGNQAVGRDEGSLVEDLDMVYPDVDDLGVSQTRDRQSLLLPYFLLRYYRR